MDKKKLRVFDFKISEKLYQKLRLKAFEKGVHMAVVIREALEDYLK